MYVTAIVLAAGKGERFSGKIPKPLAKIDGRPLIFYCLKTISQHRLIKDIILVVNTRVREGITDIVRQYRIKKVSQLVAGGRRRQDSVYNGLKAIDGRTELVFIHDGARPFIGNKAIAAVIKEAASGGAAIVGVPVKATIKEVQGSGFRVQGKFIVKKTLDRENLWEIQTPQVFRKDLILRAYKKFADRDVTDDAMLVEKLGVKVKVIEGSYSNVKITTPEDLILAQAIARGLKRKRSL